MALLAVLALVALLGSRSAASSSLVGGRRVDSTDLGLDNKQPGYADMYKLGDDFPEGKKYSLHQIDTMAAAMDTAFAVPVTGISLDGAADSARVEQLEAQTIVDDCTKAADSHVSSPCLNGKTGTATVGRRAGSTGAASKDSTGGGVSDATPARHLQQQPEQHTAPDAGHLAPAWEAHAPKPAAASVAADGDGGSGLGLEVPQHTVSVMVLGHGRSGSSLTGSIFSGQGWAYFFEPLMEHVHPGANETYWSRVAEGLPVGTCRIRCPLADMLHLLDAIHCRNSTYPERAAHLEVGGANDSEALRQLELENGSAGWQYQPLNHRMCSRLAPSGGGIAVKTIRINGRLQDFVAVAERVKVRVDLWLHLIRDPRSVLASRRRVGWGTPKSRTYADTFAWGQQICAETLADGKAGEHMPNYRLLRYETLALEPVKTTESIHAHLGRPVPRQVLERMRENEQLLHGTANAKQRAHAKQAEHTAYGVLPRNASEHLAHWKSKLLWDEVMAVNDACEEVLALHYPSRV